MKKVKRRAAAVLVLVAMVFVLTGVYVLRYVRQGGDWAGFASNGNAYSGGRLTAGSIVDRDGTVLYTVSDGEDSYAESADVRRATLHAIGDRAGNIGTGALRMFPSELLGYDAVNGIYDFDGGGAVLELALDADVCAAALSALGERRGTAAVMNYKTGELICMVSTPTFDPDSPPELAEDDTSGVYLNRFLSSAFTPGSVYKLVTLAAAIENIDDIFERDFHCDGSLAVGGDLVTCTRAHGDMKIEDALAESCNCVFASLALELGGETMARYAEGYGLASAMSVDGIGTASGRYDIAEQDIDLAWSGVGQYNDLVNPAAMLRFVAAIANGGRAPVMTQLKGSSADYDTVMKKATADKIAEIMDYCVSRTYGDENFPNLELRAKSGTAEVGGGSPNAWFVGFLADTEHPYAFVVCIENGGWGSSEAGPVANAVLQAAVSGEK